MEQYAEIYNLKEDLTIIDLIQEASLDNSSRSGLKIKNGLLFGTREWFNAIESGVIKKNVVTGLISKVYMTGHDDYPQFDIISESGKSGWTRYGQDSQYIVGRKIELYYVEQEFKWGFLNQMVSKCIVQIKVSLDIYPLPLECEMSKNE